MEQGVIGVHTWSRLHHTYREIFMTSEINTEGALEDMRLARSYLDDWYKKNSTRDALGFAASYIEKARSKDPDARLVVPAEKKDEEPDVFTQNDLAAECLYCEAASDYKPTDDEKTLRRVASTLKRAIEFAPYSVAYRAKLADVYLDLYDRSSALAVAQEAVRRNPKDLDARKLLDRIQAAPDRKAPTFFERNPDTIPPIAIGVGILGLVLFFTPMAGLGGLLIVAAPILYFVGRSKERSKLLEKAIADQYRKQK